MKRPDNDIWSVVSRTIAGESNAEDDVILEEWLLDTQNREIYDTILRIKRDCDLEPAMAVKEQVLEDVMGKIYSSNETLRSRNRIRMLIASFAAAIAILIGGVGLLWYYSMTKQDRPVEFTCSTGISKIILPDNTKVTLNQGSTISYFADFNKKIRHVTLIGEAFFDVAHDPHKKFIVSAENVDIQVLGTSFNVSAYSAHAEVITSLYTGSLEMRDAGNNQVVCLKPGDAGIYNKQLTSMTTKKFDRLSATIWMREDIIFKATPFQEVCTILERRFGVTIEVNNQTVTKKAFTGRFVSKESLEEILQIIQVNVPFSYTIEGNTVVIN